jgi:hypothetical protein
LLLLLLLLLVADWKQESDERAEGRPAPLRWRWRLVLHLLLLLLSWAMGGGRVKTQNHVPRPTSVRPAATKTSRLHGDSKRLKIQEGRERERVHVWHTSAGSHHHATPQHDGMSSNR